MAKDASTEQTKTMEATTKEPEKPKKALSAYMLFTNDIREQVTTEYKQKHGKANIGEIAKLMSARWASVGDAEKQKYEKLAAESKEKHEAAMQVYKEATDPLGCLKKKFEHLIPKKPLTAYFMFSLDEAQKQKAIEALKKESGESEIPHKRVTGKLAEMWKAFSAAEKAVYEQRHEKEMKEFESKMKAFEQTPEFAELDKLEKEQKERRQVEKKEQKEAEKVEKKAQKEAEKAEQKSQKRSLDGAGSATKRARSSKQSPTKSPEPELGQEVLDEARKLNLESALKNLAGRSEVIANGASPSKLLETLKGTGGLVNKAKNVLLGGA